MEENTNIAPRFEILTPNGWSKFEGVKKTEAASIVEIVTSAGKMLDCTPEHRIKTPNGFVFAKDLAISDIIVSKDGLESIFFVHHNRTRTDAVYDVLEVQKDNEYYTNGILSHNCEFQGSSGTLISGATLKLLKWQVPLFGAEELKVYEEPKSNNQYVIIVDVSRGKGLDYSAFSVIDISGMPYNQVATYRSNLTTPLDYAATIAAVGKRYNNAAVLVEINDIGGQVSDSLHFDFDYENIMCTENQGPKGKVISMGMKSSSDRGVRTTRSVKAIGCSMLKLLVEQNQLLIHDHDTIQELSTFSKKNNSYEAEPGCNDDLVMGLVLFGWMSSQKYFKEMTDIETLKNLRDLSDEHVEKNMVPFGIIDDGRDEYIESTIDLSDLEDRRRLYEDLHFF